MSAYHTYTDTLGNGIITGSTTLPGTQDWVQIVPTYLTNWVGSMELRVLCASDEWQLSAPGAGQSHNDAAVPGPNNLWLPISVVDVERKVWFRSINAALTLRWILEGKTSLGNIV